MLCVGINIGSLTVKVASLEGDQTRFWMANHGGRPLKVIERLVHDYPPATFFGVSGQQGHISEVAATQAAMEYLGGEFDAVASLGAEVFAVYLLKGAHVSAILSHNKCAAGSGEFSIQQIGRLGLELDEAVRRSFQGRVVPLASRCSVHCKSDITHKLNRHEASIEDILHTLHDSMADKVVALVEQCERPVRRMLLVGGVSQNRALITSLQEKLPETELVVLPESPYFEALGTAILTRKEPAYTSPQLKIIASMETLPPLAPCAERVRAISASPPNRSAAGPLVLGVDAGSTTTKAVLIDPRTCDIAASHYIETNGDPLGATRQCLRALVEQVGNRQVRLVGTTGSARELIGAYLDTPHVNNEISAHAAGATHFDPEVDTIFEIGGQDSKYILLHNGVAIDYAMNDACSAGTGSFLEECAYGDLGLTVTEIADEALRAKKPVQFKATCAAFINSDIRTALQEGYDHEDITAGVVYAIVRNYLAKVKGRRAVGKKVFFQGGVALNRAVACAFAQCLDKSVIIPPHPELLGALGVGLLALERSQGMADYGVNLNTLMAPAMSVVGQFICHACGNHCAIERFDVAGRRFPFGGRCSRFEIHSKGKPVAADAGDLVEQRNALIFASPTSLPPAKHGRIGIPRALTVHSLYPLYSNFFQRLHLEVVLSGVDPAGWLKTKSAFCFPIQIAHGAVLDLVHREVKIVFLPHVYRMPNSEGSRDSYLCPVTQASPYFISKAFPNVEFLSPLLNFARGYATCKELVEMAISRWGIPRPEAEAAWREAVAAQLQTEQALRCLGQQALAAAKEDGKPTVILVGRSYNAFPPEASQSAARKLHSMGVRVIPGDCLPPQIAGPTSWHYPNIIISAVDLVARHANLFLLHVSNFGCTIDAFLHSLLSSQLTSKPYLMLEIDAHTADAGVQTRLEAFLDVIGHPRLVHGKTTSFRAAAIDPDATVTTSTGQRVRLTDPRVKLHFPSFSFYHTQAVALAHAWQGLNVGRPVELDRRHLDAGLQYTSGRECLPLPICLGQMLGAHRRRAPGEIVGFYMVRGGAPCVVDCYLDYFSQFIREHELEDLFIFHPQEENNYYGLNLYNLAALLAPVIALADLFMEMEQSLRVVGKPGSLVRLRGYWNEYLADAPSLNALKAKLEPLIDRLAGLACRNPAQYLKVVVTGDFFMRLNPSFMPGVYDLYAQHGIILVPVNLNELLLYGAYSEMVSTAGDWGVPAGSLRAAALACLKLFRPEGRNYLTNWMTYWRLGQYESHYRKQFESTGLLAGGLNDMRSIFQHASQHISPAIFGETIPIVGKGATAMDEGYRGIIVIGPFNCMPLKISEAILKPLSFPNRIPILSYESDGFSVSPAFIRQVEVHIQQVLGT